MKTRIQNLFIALPVLLLLLPAVVQAQNAYSTNADGSIYTYSTNADGSANIVAYAGPPWVVTIPTNINGLTVTSIVEFAFSGTSLTSVNIPASVTSIGVYAFAGPSLTNINVDAANPAFSSLGGVLFDKAQTTLLDFPGGLGGSYTIPNSVTTIGLGAFWNCTSLTNATIDNGVTSIGGFAFAYTSLTNVTIPASVTNIGFAPFEGCYSMTAITVDTNNPAYSSPNGVLFDKSQATLIEYPCGLAGGSYAIPNSVTTIGEEAFFNIALNSVTIPGSVTSIGAKAFVDWGLLNRY